MTADELRDKVSENVAECSEALHQAINKSRPSDAVDYSRALANAAEAYGELEDED
jgi:hypothetical protein